MTSLPAAPPPATQPCWQGRRLAWLILALAAAAALVNALWLSKINVWVLATAPLEVGLGRDTNSIIGYSWLCDGDIMHIENTSPLKQALTFNGCYYYPDGYFLRAFYPFLVSLLCWLVGLKPAALIVNYFSFAGLVVGTGWLGRQLGGSRGAAILAGTLAASSLGVFVHLNDLSAHLLGYALYAIAVAGIYASKVWETRQNFIVHLRIGLLLAIISLAYPAGAVLTMSYLLVAFLYSPWYYATSAALLAFSARPAWDWVLTQSYRLFGLAPSQIQIGDVSTPAAANAAIWWLRLKAGLGAVLAGAGKPVLACMFISCPVTIILGLAALLLVGSRAPKTFWFLAVFTLLPCVGVVFFNPSSFVGPYIAVGSAVTIFAAFAAAAKITFRSHPALSAVVVAVVIALQLAWSLSYLDGDYFPLKSFVAIYPHFPSPFAAYRIQNLTGAFPLWRLYGGPANLLDAGGLALGTSGAIGPVTHSFAFAAILNGFFVFFLLALAATFLRLRARIGSIWRWLGIGAFTVLAAAAAGFACQRRVLAPLMTSSISQFAGRQPISREVDLSPAVISNLRKTLRENPGLEVQIAMRATGVVAGAFRVGRSDVPAVMAEPLAGQTRWRLDRQALLQGLAAGNSTLAFEGALQDGSLAGWQRGAAPGQRVFPLTSVQGTPYLPSFELRLFDRARNAIVWIGY